MITQSYSSPMLAEGIGAFTSQFKKGGMTRKNTKKKLSSKDLEFIEAYANGGSVGDNVIKKDTYEVGDKIKFIDSFRKEEKEGNIYQINEVGNYVVTYGSGITAGMRSVNPDEVVGAYPKEEPKKKRFGLFADGGKIKNQYEGRTPEDIWNNLSKAQRQHFLYDHLQEISEYKGLEKDLPSKDVIKAYNSNWKTLDKDIKNRFTNHTREGQYAKGGKTKTKFSKGDKVVGQFRYEYGQGLQPVSLMDNGEQIKGVISNVRKIDTTTMYAIDFDNGEQLQYPDFAIDTFIRKVSYAKGGSILGENSEGYKSMSELNKDFKRIRQAPKQLNEFESREDSLFGKKVKIKLPNEKEFTTTITSVYANGLIKGSGKYSKLYEDKYVTKIYDDGGTTDPKPSAQDILKRLGYNIPQSEEMQEEEPKIIRGWVDDEPYYFAKGGMSKDDSPKVYIADLLEYNNGRLVGKWFDLTDYSDGAELMQDIQQMLDEQTKKDKFGDVHEEYAVHDYENFPSEFYSEYMGEADFDKLISLINEAEDSDLPFDVIVKAMADLGRDELSEVKEAYFGSVSPSMGNEWRDFAYEYVENVGGIIGVSNADYYFDYESFGSDERINMGGEAEEQMGYEDLSDTELGEQLVEEVGGIEALDKSTIEMYFDYDKFGRDLQYDFTAIRGEDGDYYFFNSNFKKGGKLNSNPDPEDDGEYVLSEDEKKIIRGYVDDEPYYFAEGGNVLKKTTYVPNRDVKELMVVLKGSLTKLSGSDIIDGVYVKNTKLKSAPKENAKELFAQLQKQAKKDDSEIGFDESDIQKLFDAGFSVQDIRNIFFGYTPPIVNADTEFGNTTNGLLSFTADYQKKKMDEIIKISEDGFYEMGLKYPSFSWESIVKKYNIKLKPTIIIDEKSKVFRYKHEVYLGDGIAIGHTISTFRDTWEDSGDKIGFLNLKKPTPYQKERDYQAGFNGGYWGIVVKNKEILYDVIGTLLKQDDSYLKDLEVFWNGLGGIDSENVKKQKFAKGGAIAEKFILSFNYNPSNLSNKEAEKIVSKYTKNWKRDNDFDEVSFFVMDLKKSQSNELEQELKMEDVYNIEITKSRYSEGGQFAKGGKVPKHKIGDIVYGYYVYNYMGYQLVDYRIGDSTKGEIIDILKQNDTIKYVIKFENGEVEKLSPTMFDEYITKYAEGGSVKKGLKVSKKYTKIAYRKGK